MLKKNHSRLFTYPLPDPQNTIYHKLGIPPEATNVEISDALSKMIGQLNKEKDEINKQLTAIYRVVDGIPQAYSDLENIRGKGKDVDQSELEKKEIHLAKLEKEAQRINPDYKNLFERSDELARKINEVNQWGLNNPENRQEYDKKTPPYALLKFEDCDQEVFAESESGKKLALYLLRLEFSEFVADLGEGSYHPSDLTRNNFSSDFTHHPLLDGE
jgi:uncharacterized coiled-coil DUF342 family protein